MRERDLTSKKNLKELLQRHGTTPNKKMGQHFLVSKKALNEIISYAQLKSDDVVLEIGPGVGTLTYKLAEKVKEVIGVEKDKILCDVLKKTLSGFSNVKIINEDIRKILSSNIQYPISNINYYKVVSNLPYYLSSYVIRKFLELEDKPKLMVLTLQKELAERICAQPGQMSLISVTVQFYGKPSLGEVIKKTAFWPRPEVDSRILVIKDIRKPEGVDEEKFFKIAKAGFRHKRKMLKNNLASNLGLDKHEVEQRLKELELNPTVRPQALSVESWKKLSTGLNKPLNML